MSINEKISIFTNNYLSLKNTVQDQENIRKYIDFERLLRIDNLFKIITNIYNNGLRAQNNTSIISNPVYFENYLLLLDIYSSYFSSINNKIKQLAQQKIDCQQATYSPIQIIFEDNRQKLVKLSSDKLQCKIIILDSQDVKELTTDYNPETKTITSNLIMSIAEINNLSNNFTPDEQTTIKNFISNIAGLNNNIVSDIKIYKQQDGSLFTTIEAKPSFPSSLPSSYSIDSIPYNKAIINLSLISKSLPTNFNIDYIRNLIKNTSEVML